LHASRSRRTSHMLWKTGGGTPVRR
jgi:hypothetical protein